jgi:hypothetical protein
MRVSGQKVGRLCEDIATEIRPGGEVEDADSDSRLLPPPFTKGLDMLHGRKLSTGELHFAQRLDGLTGRSIRHRRW